MAEQCHFHTAVQVFKVLHHLCPGYLRNWFVYAEAYSGQNKHHFCLFLKLILRLVKMDFSIMELLFETVYFLFYLQLLFYLILNLYIKGCMLVNFLLLYTCIVFVVSCMFLVCLFLVLCLLCILLLYCVYIYIYIYIVHVYCIGHCWNQSWLMQFTLKIHQIY